MLQGLNAMTATNYPVQLTFRTQAMTCQELTIRFTFPSQS